jgi:hypothetical protein
MPRLPVDVTTMSNQNNLPDGQMPVQQAKPSAFGAGIGEALTGLSGAGQDLAARIMANDKQNQQFDLENQFIQLQDLDNQEYTQGVRGLSGNGEGWWQTTRAATQQRFSDWLQTLPEQYRGQYQAKASAFLAGRTQQAFTDQYKQQDLHTSGLISDAQQKSEQQVWNNYKLYPQFAQQMQALIDQAPLPEEKKVALKQAATNSLANLAEMARAQHNPHSVAPSAVPEFSPEINDIVDAAAKSHGLDPAMMRRLVQIESGGNPKAVKDSYSGLGQLSAKDFQQYGSGDIFDPTANANAMAAKLAADSAGFEQKYGRPPTAADMYLQYQQGVGGFAAHMAHPEELAWKNMASTAEGRKRGEAWSKQAIWGNVPGPVKGQFPNGVEGMTSAQFMQVWRDKLGAGTVETAASAALTPEQQQRRDNAAQTQIAKNEREAAVAAAAAKAERMNSTLVDIANGPAPQAAYDAALKSGLLSDYSDQKKAQGVLETRLKGNESLNLGIALMSGGKAVSNLYDKDQRDGIDAYFNNAVKGGADPAETAARIFDRTGLVAPAFALAIRGAMATNDQGRYTSAMNVAAGMLRQNPNAFVGTEGGKQIEEAATEYRRLTEVQAMSPEQAVQQIMKAAQEKPEPVKQEQFALFQKQSLTQEKIDGRLSGLFTSWSPFSDKPFSVRLPGGEQRTALASIYSDWAKQAYEQFRDPDKALAQADLKAQKMFGVQNGVMMVYPPSKSGLPKIADQADGYSWVNQQAAELVLKQKGVTVDPSQIVLLPIEQRGYSTRAAFDGTPYQAKRADGTTYTTVPYIVTVEPKTPDQARIALNGAFLPDVQTYMAGAKPVAPTQLMTPTSMLRPAPPAQPLQTEQQKAAQTLADKQAQLAKSASRVRETASDQARQQTGKIADLQAQIEALDKRDADLQKTPRGDMTILRGILKKERDRLEGEIANLKYGQRAD